MHSAVEAASARPRGRRRGPTVAIEDVEGVEHHGRRGGAKQAWAGAWGLEAVAKAQRQRGSRSLVAQHSIYLLVRAKVFDQWHLGQDPSPLGLMQISATVPFFGCCYNRVRD